MVAAVRSPKVSAAGSAPGVNSPRPGLIRGHSRRASAFVFPVVEVVRRPPTYRAPLHACGCGCGCGYGRGCGCGFGYACGCGCGCGVWV